VDAYRLIRRGIRDDDVGCSKQTAAAWQDIAPFDVKGTVAGEGKYGFAIIEEKGTRKQRLVKAGDVVAGAKVVRIKRNAVDVLVEGAVRTLKMAEMKEAPILPSTAVATASTGTLALPGTRPADRASGRDGGHGNPAQPGADPTLL
jgi:hypothetical protein